MLEQLDSCILQKQTLTRNLTSTEKKAELDLSSCKGKVEQLDSCLLQKQALTRKLTSTEKKVEQDLSSCVGKAKQLDSCLDETANLTNKLNACYSEKQTSVDKLLRDLTMCKEKTLQLEIYLEQRQQLVTSSEKVRYPTIFYKNPQYIF